MALSLLVDDREPEFLKDALKDIGVVMRISEDIGGDYVWDSNISGTWAIERKSASDLVGSIVDSRLNDQIRNCLNHYNHTVLLVEGVYTKTDNGEIQIRVSGGGTIHRKLAWHVLEDCLEEYQMFGVMLARSSSLADTVQRIRRLIDISNKTEFPMLMRRKNTLDFGTKMDDRLYLMTAFPGIGIKLAQELLNQFRYPHIIMNLFEKNHELLKDIPGLGPKRIEAVRKVWME